MGERPLSDEVARAARAYLAALVSPSARADAWHDLLAEVRYWQDDQLVPVLRLAHQVVGQHERVTDEAAAFALADVGIVEVDDLAVVLNVDPVVARDLREQADRARESGERVTGHAVAAQDASRAVSSQEAEPADAEETKSTDAIPVDAAGGSAAPPGTDDPTPAAVPASTAPSSTDASLRSAAPALRIGFDDQDAVDTGMAGDDRDDRDDQDEWDDESPDGILTYQRLVWIAVIVWILVVIAWLLSGS
jgi:hypothetical protein